MKREALKPLGPNVFTRYVRRPKAKDPTLSRLSLSDNLQREPRSRVPGKKERFDRREARGQVLLKWRQKSKRIIRLFSHVFGASGDWRLSTVYASRSTRHKKSIRQRRQIIDLPSAWISDASLFIVVSIDA